MANNDRNDDEYFLYIGQKWDPIPRDVTHVKVHPSVEVIENVAFVALS
jgi:hypothetical protein